MMSILISVILLILAIWPTLAIAYLGLLTILSRQPPQPPSPTRRLRFAVIVPAHNEGAHIARTVASLKTLQWPADAWQCVVVADNCTDDTAERALEAGALVWERHDPQRKGKGHALQFAFARCLADASIDAIVVIDADSLVSPNLLEAFAARFAQGAQAVQAWHGVANPQASWRTRLVALGYAAFHGVRGRGREALHVSAGLRGNGMGFTPELIKQHPFQLNSLAEDLEYGAQLGLAGIRVWHVDEARVDADIAARADAAGGQRHRWEAGRWQVVRQYALPLLRQGWAQRSPVCVELATELLTPPLAQLGLLWLLLWLASLITLPFAALAPAMVVWSILLAAVLLAHVLRGWQLSGTGWRTLTVLAWVPFYVVWKVLVLVRQRGMKEWRRTGRS